MNCGRRETVEETELPNEESMKMLREKENYKCLEILKVDNIKLIKWKSKKSIA